MDNFIDSLIDKKIIKNKIIKNKIIAKYMRLVDYKYFTLQPYIDIPKKICCNMTISAPHMHIYALEILKPWKYKGGKALDVGCGSGYITTILSLMLGKYGKVFGIDNKQTIIDYAINNISNYNKLLLSDNRINIFFGNGWKGLKKYQYYDIIHVGACATEIPYKLIKQLNIGGRMFIPLEINNIQKAYLITRTSEKKFKKKYLLDVMFVYLEK
jgi:protein-L-isoaspartate(D-aspartate) O-methyltransferase